MSRAIKDIYEDYRVKKEALAPFEKEINEKIGSFVKEVKNYVRYGYVDPVSGVRTRLGSDFKYWDVGLLSDSIYYNFYINNSAVYIENPNDIYGDDLQIGFEDLDNAEAVVLKAVRKFVTKKIHAKSYAWEVEKKRLEEELANHLKFRE